MTRRDIFAAAVGLPLATFGAESKPKSTGRVRHERLPDGGIQPQIGVDGHGTMHVLYYSGDPRHGNVSYTRSTDGGATFSSVLQVNRSGSAIAAGTIRGPQLALGRSGRVHVAWNGSARLSFRAP